VRNVVAPVVFSTEACEHPFVTSQGSAFMRFPRALDRQNVTEAFDRR
jgi:hypothetical protein